MNVLITGGCGFIGSNLIRYLLPSTDWNITIFDNLSVGSTSYLPHSKRVHFIQGDICVKKDVENAMKLCDSVVHLAAMSGIKDSVIYTKQCLKTNITGLANVMDVSNYSDINRFVFASSGSVLGDQKMPLKETMVPSPRSPYAASKLAGEGLCDAYLHTYGLNTVSLRFTNVYGPHCDHKHSVIPSFLRNSMHGNNLVVHGDGSQIRDFIHAYDVCGAIHNALRRDVNGVFHIGSGKKTSINYLAKHITKTYGGHILYDRQQDCGTKKCYIDTTKAYLLLDFHPFMSIKDGIKNTMEYMKM